MNEIGKIREFLGSEPLKAVENSEGLSLEEQFRLFIPDILVEEDKQLITELFMYKYKGERLTGKDEERFRDLVIVDTIMGGELLPSLVSKLKQISKYKKRSGKILTTEQLRQVLRNMVFDYRVKLDDMDLKILNAMSENIYISMSRIAEQANTHRGTIHYHKIKLEKKCRLETFFRLNPTKIGLTNLVILVEGEAYVESPYLISRHELWGRKLHTLFSIVVPSTAVNQAQKTFEKSFPKTWIWNVNRFENHLSFSSYNTDTGDWNIDWTSWSLYLSEVLSQGWNKVIPEKRTETDSSESSEKSITTIDLQFITKLLEKFDISTSDLSEEFRYSVPHASRIKESLISRGILQPGLNIDYIGLNENILFLVESDPNTLNAFVYAVKELPKTWIYWMKTLKGRSYLACWLELPLGSITPFERAVREILRPLAEYEIFFRSKQEGSQGSFLELLDTETKTWKWSPEMLKIKS